MIGANGALSFIAVALALAVLPACTFHALSSPLRPAAELDCDADATVVRSAPPEFPDLQRRPGHPLEWVVDVLVKLDAKGRVRNAAVWKSYGQTSQNRTAVRLALNAQALKAANASTYKPKVVHCKAVPSTYLYQITFTGGP